MPITPGSTGASFDVLLAFSLDKEANARVQSGISTMEAELKRLQDEAAGVGKEYKKSGEDVKKTSKETSQTLRAEARAIRAEVASMTSDVRNFQIGLLRDISSTISSISQKALITGGAIVGGIFAEVQRYVNTAPDATRETRAWVAATEDLGRSRARIDQELLRTALPLLQTAARVARDAAGIVERHPEITNLALKSGAILVGVGVMGSLLSRGIKLVADVQYLATIPTQLTAAKMQDLAADKQLAAARVQLKNTGGGGIPGAAGGAAAGLAVPITAIVTAVLAHAGFQALLIRAGADLRKRVGLDRVVTGGANLIGQGLGRLAGLSDKEIDRKATVFSAIIGRLTGDIDTNSQLWKEASSTIKRAGETVSEAAGMIKGSINEAEIVEAFSSWKEDDARLVREAAENRKEIIRDGEQEIAKITRDYTSQRVDINKRFNQAATDIRNRFEEESKQAEEDYQINRAQTAQDGALRLQELEQSHQERLRQIRQDAEDRIEGAERARDALGLVREQERLVEEEAEENRSFRAEQARIRQETARRLAELDQQFALEQQRRAEQFAQELARNEQERAEELAQAAQAFQEEQRQAREAQAQKLRDLAEGLHAERQRRREVFIEQIRDLDASLLGERALRQRAYNDMLRDAQDFFNLYRAALPSASNFGSVTGSVGTIPIRDSGGYMSRGLYAVAQNGIKEFALSGNTTKAAEQAFGASLTDESLGRLFGRLGEARAAVYNDNRRLMVPLSKESKTAYEEGAKAALNTVLGVR